MKSAPGSLGETWRRDLLRVAATAPLYERLDAMRRALGFMLGPVRPDDAEMRYSVICEAGGFVLRDYSTRRTGPALLLVPAPIKAPYIWDLVPGASVVRRCVDAGFQVLVVEWRAPPVDDPDTGLAGYARMLGRCVDASSRATGEPRVFLVGHSLGGTLAAILACLHSERLDGVVLLGSPLNFGPAIGAFGPFVAAAPRARDAVPLHGDMPGSLLSMLTVLAAPQAFGWWRIADLMASASDPAALARCLAVERWTLDERPIARRLFEDVWERLFRDNALMCGTLEVGGRSVRPEALSAPLLAVVDAQCAIAPPAAVLPFVEAAGSADKQVVWYGGDVGVSLRHVGMLVGRNAHRDLWPGIETWLRGRCLAQPVRARTTA